MTKDELRNLLRDFRKGELSEDQVLAHLRSLPFEPLEFAMVDHHRELRKGFPEVIFCERKTADQVAEIARKIVQNGAPLLATRASKDHFLAVRKILRKCQYNTLARTITASAHVRTKRRVATRGTILVISAGTSDVPVAEEAYETATILGNPVEKLYDVGVAGIHRLLAHTEQVQNASVVIVIAGMEGALPSVVGGLVDAPVIAVPTSVGYGTSFGGMTALLAMLNSCAPGVTVVNIDNGFGAGFAAALMNRK
ncbi:MAG: nickel pincer cofactor biosynthesis protein LarB [Bacteroidota bacterium]